MNIIKNRLTKIGLSDLFHDDIPWNDIETNALNDNECKILLDENNYEELFVKHQPNYAEIGVFSFTSGGHTGFRLFKIELYGYRDIKTKQQKTLVVIQEIDTEKGEKIGNILVYRKDGSPTSIRNSGKIDIKDEKGYNVDINFTNAKTFEELKEKAIKIGKNYLLFK